MVVVVQVDITIAMEVVVVMLQESGVEALQWMNNEEPIIQCPLNVHSTLGSGIKISAASSAVTP